MLKAEVMETLLYGCATWLLTYVEFFASFLRPCHELLLRMVGVHRRQSPDHRMSYANALKKAQCESVEITVRKQTPSPFIMRKARERELATFDVQSTSSGIAEPYAR